MPGGRADIIAALRKELLLLQGFRPASDGIAVDMGLGPIAAAFPGAVFPTGVMHELLCGTAEDAAATAGFTGALLGGLMRRDGVCVWVSTSRMIFPPALKTFGVAPDRVVFVDLEREKDVLWAMEEALRCEGLAAVVGEARDISFTVSRRLQLAVEQSRATGFILRHAPRNMHATACAARWRVTPAPSAPDDGLPGVGFPRWQVELLKARGGRPGVWQMEWASGRFHPVYEDIPAVPAQGVRKTG